MVQGSAADFLCMTTLFKTLALGSDGQDLIEYALLAGLVSLTALFAVNNVWSDVNDQVNAIP